MSYREAFPEFGISTVLVVAKGGKNVKHGASLTMQFATADAFAPMHELQNYADYNAYYVNDLH